MKFQVPVLIHVPFQRICLGFGFCVDSMIKKDYMAHRR